MPAGISANMQQFLDEMGESLKNGLLPARIYNDPEIHQLELDRVFARSWVYLGHESEIPHNGDYVLRYIGEDPYILVRGEDGKIRLFLDACRHRGAMLCRAEKGNASHFRCSYHGWTFKNTGELVGVPALQQAYPGLDRSQWGLIEIKHVDSVYGLIFGAIDPLVPTLDEYLGGMKWYLELMFGLSSQGMEVVGEPHRWIMDANWKLGADNFVGDDYHTLFLHRSMGEIGIVPISQSDNMAGYHIHAGNGHGLSLSMDPDPDAPGPQFCGLTQDIVDKIDMSHLSHEQREIARRTRVAVGTVFPNFSFLAIPLTVDPETVPHTYMMTVRAWQPRGPKEMDVWSWALVFKEMPEEVKRRSYRVVAGNFSPSGIFEQDDTEPWATITRAGGSLYARRFGFKLNYQMGLEGIGAVEQVSDWPGPGTVYFPRFEEGVQRSLWTEWLKYMTTPEQ